jgi:hypothetical protein
MAKQKTNHGATTTKETVASWQRNSNGDLVQVSLDRYRGQDTIDVRTWVEKATRKGIALKATHKGITLGVSQLPKLAAALLRAYIVARKRGLIP